MSQPVVVEVLTKQGCHLCVDALAAARQVCAEFGIEPLERDITTDEELLSIYAEELPVLLIDGRVKDFWRIDPQRLRRLLSETDAGR
ncbi:glutaredoxin family protein [Nesterenkonia lutea]|uniref:Glutaredoxin n=1 Tax=Nesterenkonia lutea TaxID=272919 RepID=A0ABR9JHQ8_9MICC|nr:glutaredoxin family protein [Nesterenkonia lutea]MBE1525470.1 glutaredoxin [Nesterenkonia lutea]